MPNLYKCSDGTTVNQGQINSRLQKNYKFHDSCSTVKVCECCQKARAVDHDHTIAQSRCKVIHKTELIWTRDNWVYSCRKCHEEWENFKSGAYLNHLNASMRMFYVKGHDNDLYLKRINL